MLAAVGADWQHDSVPRDGSITDVVLTVEGPVPFDDTRRDPRTTGAAQRVPGMRRAVATPLAHRGDGDASPMALVLSRPDGSAPFGPLECDMISGFADQVATALALHTAQVERAGARRAQSSERLAHHLNEEIMGELMRLGLDLAGLATQVAPELLEQVLDHIDTLDGLTRRIRDTVFSLDLP